MSAAFVVQTFRAGKRGALLADSPFHARRMAERLAVRKALVVAFMREGDPNTGEYEDAKLIAAYGAVPDEIMEMQRV